MRYLAALLLILAVPATAQTLEQRIDKIIVDANLAKNANARVEAEAKRLKADLAKPPVVTPPVVTPPVVVPPAKVGDGKIVVAAEGDSISGTFQYMFVGLYKSSRPDVEFHGLAVGGSGLDLLNERLPALLALKPDLVSVTVGANDLTNLPSAQAYADELKKYTDQIRATGAKVVVTTVLPRYFTGFAEAEKFTALHSARRKELAVIIKAATWVDGVADFASDPAMGPDAAAFDKLLYSDGLHPTNSFEVASGEGGHTKLFRIYKPAMDKLAVDRPLSAAPHAHSMMPFIDNSKIPAPSVGFSTARIKVETFDTPKQNLDGTGQFRTGCGFSHMSYDDPIVFPGKQGAAHLHVFFGNVGTNYASTAESIASTGNSTCSGGTANRSAYWVPAVIDTKDGAPLKPWEISAYYKSDFLPGATTNPFPAGLRMIAGDMKSTGPQDRTDWGCSAPNGTEVVQGAKSIPANCPAGYKLINTIEFPPCWNGVDLDSPDHKSHMAFTVWDNDAKKVTCPKSHPVQVPTLTQKIVYIVAEEGAAARLRLSSDNYGTDKPGGFSAHGDWFNGWDPKVEAIWLKNCLQAARDCHGLLLGDGTALF